MDSYLDLMAKEFESGEATSLNNLDNWLNNIRFKSACKNCGTWINHSSLYAEINPKINTCKQYVPTDNLEYLEWGYNRKHGYRISVY